MDNFAKYAYLNSYLNRFKKILGSDTLTVPELHNVLNRVGFKSDNGTMYEKTKLDGILNDKFILNKMKEYLGIQNIEQKPIEKFKPQETSPNYYSDEDMKNASDELLKNDEVFFESKTVKITENDLQKIVKECVKKIYKNYL